jgi:hypothetical protein
VLGETSLMVLQAAFHLAAASPPLLQVGMRHIWVLADVLTRDSSALTY